MKKSLPESLDLELLTRELLDVLSPDAVSEVAEQQVETAIKLAHRYLAQADTERAAHFFAGWLKLTVSQHENLSSEIFGKPEMLDGFFASLRAQISQDIDWVQFGSAAKLALSHESEQVVNVVFIGDCLIWDIALQVQILLAAKGVTVRPAIFAQRVGADLRQKLQAIEGTIDLFFYSPFSYELSGAYADLQKKIVPSQAARENVQREVEDVGKTLALLIDGFEAPIYLHRVSGVIQNSGTLPGAVRFYATQFQRTFTIRWLNRQLHSLVDTLNTPQIHWLPEDKPLQQQSALSLGQVSYDAGELHPTLLAQRLAESEYLAAILASVWLKERKVLITDLDNTLWEGVIGEGEVKHHLHRQEMLKQLKEKGVLLAVSSKNDEDRVSWEGAILNDSDFVAYEVNWNLKLKSLASISEQLNIKPSSFVFLDDRADERFLVQESLPEVLTLDPDDEFTWHLLSYWLESLKGGATGDRTALYQQRAERTKFLDADLESDKAAAYGSLSLELDLTLADFDDIDRVTELINRTNQFNISGYRTTHREVQQWIEDGRVIVGRLADRFGPMGIVSVLVFERDMAIRVEHFVLSCRAFGFGVEDAMLDVLKRLQLNVQGELKKSLVNTACHDVFQRNGFDQVQEDNWCWEPGEVSPGPDWLSINDQTTVQ